MNQSNFEILSNPIGLVAFIVMTISWLSMGCLAKDHLGAKGIKAYFVVATGWGILIYLKIRRENNKSIGFLFWVFVASAIVLYFAAYRT